MTRNWSFRRVQRISRVIVRLMPNPEVSEKILQTMKISESAGEFYSKNM